MTLGTQGYFEEKNPAALENMTAVMLETARKGYWKATPEQLKAVAGLHTDLVAKYGTSGGGFADNNAKLQDFIAENASAPQAADYKQQISEMKEAALADGNVQKGMTLKKNTVGGKRRIGSFHHLINDTEKETFTKPEIKWNKSSLS